MDELTFNDWDVLIYIASYIAGFGIAPTRQDIIQDGLDRRVVERLVILGFLIESEGRLRPVYNEKSQVLH